MIQTKLYSIYPPFNNLVHWIENSSNDIGELYSAYYELLDILNKKSKDKLITQESISIGETNKMKITFWRNMN